ncbi:MAG: RHS repeat-associated core domain-containing protein [Blastocatellia bacterium]|nr:RHS repeat-associated core domain-containing protein [Blastocatellia bacterium]
MLAEYDADDAIDKPSKEYVYSPTGMIAVVEAVGSSQEQISYLTEDHLGSPRLITDNTGTVISRRDFYPYGEQISGVGGRSQIPSYNLNHSLKQKFTGYERDDETGLDFAQARYFSSKYGRFLSSDEFTGGPEELFFFASTASNNPTFYADIATPQSLNKYQYCLNSPFRYVDPKGHQQGGEKSFIDSILDSVRAIIAPYTPRLRGGSSDSSTSADKDLLGADKSLRTFTKEANKASEETGKQALNSLEMIDPIGATTVVGYAIKQRTEKDLAILAVGTVFQIRSSIKNNKALIKLAEEAGSTVQSGLDNLVSQLAKGNLNPGIGTKNLFGDIFYARNRDGARVFFRKRGDTIEIVGKSNKANEQQVIDQLRKIYQK